MINNYRSGVWNWQYKRKKTKAAGTAGDISRLISFLFPLYSSLRNRTHEFGLVYWRTENFACQKMNESFEFENMYTFWFSRGWICLNGGNDAREWACVYTTISWFISWWQLSLPPLFCSFDIHLSMKRLNSKLKSLLQWTLRERESNEQ